MPRYICKFIDGDKSYYLEWSTIVDAPVTSGMSLEEFRGYFRDEYGRKSMADLEDRLKRVEEKGTSSIMHDSVDDVIALNRAGKEETRLTLEQIIEGYCRGQDGAKIPLGD